MKARLYNSYDWLVFNKLNKTQVIILGFTSYSTPKQPLKLLSTGRELRHIIRYQSCDNGCKIPQFVHQMNATLFAQIEGIVDFNFKGSKGGKSGYFLLFNIDGRPMGCFTFEGEDISPEVRHKVLLFY